MFRLLVELQQLCGLLFRLLVELQQLSADVSVAISRFFYDDTVEEFIMSVIQPKLDDVRKIVLTAQAQLTLEASPKDDRSAGCTPSMEVT